jgi:hypothetical protein
MDNIQTTQTTTTQPTSISTTTQTTPDSKQLIPPQASILDSITKIYSMNQFNLAIFESPDSIDFIMTTEITSSNNVWAGFAFSTDKSMVFFT